MFVGRRGNREAGAVHRVAAGTLAHFVPQERREVSAVSDARLLLVLAPWPGEGHPSL